MCDLRSLYIILFVLLLLSASHPSPAASIPQLSFHFPPLCPTSIVPPFALSILPVSPLYILPAVHFQGKVISSAFLGRLRFDKPDSPFFQKINICRPFPYTFFHLSVCQRTFVTSLLISRSRHLITPRPCLPLYLEALSLTLQSQT